MKRISEARSELGVMQFDEQVLVYNEATGKSAVVQSHEAYNQTHGWTHFEGLTLPKKAAPKLPSIGEHKVSVTKGFAMVGCQTIPASQVFAVEAALGGK